MRKFTRGHAPDFLITKWKGWGERYKNNRERNPAFPFQWPTHEGKTINVLLEPSLKSQTDGHCSFCDNFPIRTKEDSIDHFKPKSVPAYYELVCQWENLYYSCQNCQQYKLEQFNEFLLRPDDLEFSFETYFVYSYSSHKIDPNPVLSEDEKLKAKTTIEVFGLNDTGHVAARRISLERYEGKKKLNEDIEVNDFPYRFTIMQTVN
jgi:uncharacterized protein (TIGR02646 family)